MPFPTYAVKIDWNNDGDFLDVGEIVTNACMKVTYWRGFQDEFGHAEAGGCRITLRDTDGTYVPENAGSALYGSLVPNRTVCVNATYGGTVDIVQNNPLAAGGLALVVVDGTNFTIDSYIQIESEHIHITNIVANTLTIERAHFGTEAVAHVLNTPIVDLFPLFYGYIDDIIPAPGPNEQRVLISCVDGFDQLRRTKVSLAIDNTGLYSGIKLGAITGIIYHTLNNAGWDMTKIRLDDGLDPYPLVYAEKESCLTLLQQVEASEFGFLYFGGDGLLNWEDRHYRLTNTRCTTSQYTTTVYGHIKPISPLSAIRNKVTMTVHPQTFVDVLVTLWILQDTGANSPLFGPGESKTFIAHYADADGHPSIAGNVITPTIAGAPDDYHAFSDTAEAGTDLSANCDITALVDNTSRFADRSKITVTNSGTVSFYLTKLIIRGRLYKEDGKLEIESESAASKVAYGTREFDATLPFYQSSTALQGIADNIIYTSKDPVPKYEIDLTNRSAAILAEILNRRISDRITVQAATLNIDDDFFIEHVRHEILMGSEQLHKCWWQVSKVDSRMYWILNTSQLGSGYAFPTVLGY